MTPARRLSPRSTRTRGTTEKKVLFFFCKLRKIDYALGCQGRTTRPWEDEEMANGLTITARILPGSSWAGATTFRARGFESGIRTACRKLGVSTSSGCTRERVGASQWRITGNDTSIMVIVSDDSTVGEVVS